MTLPAVLHNYKRQEMSAKIKKFYTNMSQAVKLSEIDNGPAFYWSKEVRKVNDDGSVTNTQGTIAFFNHYLAKYLKTVAKEEDEKAFVIMADGSTLSMNIGHCLDIIFDYNGKKAPNTLGIDQFDFLLCTEEGYNAGYLRSRQNPFEAYFPSKCRKNSCSRNEFLSACKNNAVFCSSLLMYDGWNFKDDYPYKL